MMSEEKQIEEMFNIIADGVIDGENNHGVPTGKTCLNIAQTIYDAGYRKQSEWISVEERLPDLYGTYLVYTYDNHIKLGYFCELVIGLPPSFDDFAVTHWMPLPEPPDMKGGE